MHINVTFQVNRFNVPLLSIVRTTGLNTSFYIANIFLVGKAEVDYILWRDRVDVSSVCTIVKAME
jgi:hypothetical protein